MLKSLKTRWGINSNFQLVVILFVFSAAGSASLYVRTFIFNLLGIETELSLWIKIPLFIINYQILLIVIGTLCGQFRFFYNFQKKSFSRFKRKKKELNQSEKDTNHQTV
ncbi:DUF6787 family protein [Saccharicrinis aurantiacus]|uniref:DUF6787 family protein n=1 Tax=Saccharicrinis aurantiacus TaxID=1849719 RepID=UPI000838977E|nr:DUF6787 family protein [Saccharicrinis aurantiacus]